MIIIGGDTNNRPLANLLLDFPDINLIQAPPTRRGAQLDETACNFSNYIKKCTVEPPFQAENGTRSVIETFLSGLGLLELHLLFLYATVQAKQVQSTYKNIYNARVLPVYLPRY